MTPAETLNTALEAKFLVNNIWILFSSVLVFIMHLGFSALEAGFVRKKNVVNILFKNVMIIAIGVLSYYLIGYGLMYPGAGSYLAFAGFGINIEASDLTMQFGNFTKYTDFIFQAMFAATCCTIVSGAVAERIKLMPFLLFCTFFVSLSYPITGMWKWGQGWLDQLGFYDFAGSTLVHSVGGWGALAGVILLGPREGKFTKEGIKAIPGHSMPLAAMGVFLLWFGWFGFNGGSVLSADAGSVSHVFVTTTLAAAAGAIGSFFCSSLLFKNFDLSMVLNGILGGLVGITAGADVISPFSSIIVGIIAGIIIPISVTFFDRMRLDDPVGAISVHLVCGFWGTLAVSIFAAAPGGYGSFYAQLVGVLSVGVFTFSFCFGLFYLLKMVMGIRVSQQEERKGLDPFEHGISAYS